MLFFNFIVFPFQSIQYFHLKVVRMDFRDILMATHSNIFVVSNSTFVF